MIIGLFTDTYLPEINGVVTSVKQLQEELEKNGHTVYIITSSNEHVVKRTGNIIRIPGVTLKKLYGYHLSGIYSLFAVNHLKKLKLDLIHVHTEYGIGIFGRIISKQFNLPLVYTYHTMMEDYAHYFTRVTMGHFEKQVNSFIIRSSKLFADKCTELIVPSKKTYNAMIRYGVKNHINIIPTGINISKYSIHSYNQKKIEYLRRELGLGLNDFVVTFVGRIAHEKNIMELIEAFKILREERINDIKLLLIGNGPQFEEVSLKLKEYRLEKHIVLTGAIPNDKIALYYQVGDIFASTSTSETQGLTFIEAMASHLPVLCRYDVNLEDVIEEGRTGFFVDGVDDLAKSIVDVYNMDDDSYNNLCISARIKAQEYSSSAFYEKVILVYGNAIKNKQLSRKNRKNKKRKISLSHRIKK